MVDFEAYAAEEGDRYQPLSSDSESDSDGERSTTRHGRGRDRRRRREGRRIRLERAGISKGWSCQCENCVGKEATRHGTTFSEYNDVDPKGNPPNRQHFFFLLDRDVPAFSLRDREFGEYCLALEILLH